jgi:hypothetical protein
MHMVGQPVEQCAGEPLGPQNLRPVPKARPTVRIPTMPPTHSDLIPPTVPI